MPLPLGVDRRHLSSHGGRNDTQVGCLVRPPSPMARPKGLFGLGLRGLGKVLSDALAPARNLLGLRAVVLERRL
jgi:hypothetical protein